MSNMSKTIAILGVVAGLGVAALPLSSYAAEQSVEWGTGTAGTDYSDDAALGPNSWVKTDTTVHLKIEDKLSISSTNDDVELKLPDGASDGIWTANAMHVTVTTGNAYGYKLTMHGSATDNPNGLTLDGDETVFIPTSATLSGATSSWGYKYGNATYTAATEEGGQGTWTDSLGENWTEVATSKNAAGAVLRSSEKATNAAGESVAVQFGAYIADGQAAGTYNGKVTFTATNQAKTSTSN